MINRTLLRLTRQKHSKDRVLSTNMTSSILLNSIFNNHIVHFQVHMEHSLWHYSGSKKCLKFQEIEIFHSAFSEYKGIKLEISNSRYLEGGKEN